MKEKVFIKTEDRGEIAAEIYLAKNDSEAVWIVFSHMMPATKESWDSFAEELSENGFSSVAYDFSGHGESSGGPSGYLEFIDAEHQDGILDLRSVIEFIKSKDEIDKKIFLIGASIGANLSLQELAENNSIKKAVLLSPGLNYRGVETIPFAQMLEVGKEVMIVSAKDDNGNDVEAIGIFNTIPEGVKKEIKIFDEAGHGTEMLQSEPELKKLILEFLKR